MLQTMPPRDIDAVLARLATLEADLTTLTAELMQSMDCVAILTDHGAFDDALIANSAALIFETRNALKNFPRTNVVRL